MTIKGHSGYSGYSGNEKISHNENDESGDSGYSGILHASKITTFGGKSKKDIAIFKDFTPIFFSQNLRDCTEEVMDKARTFQEIKKEREQERGKPFGSSEADIKEIKELRMKGDVKNNGYVKLPFGKGNMTGEAFMKTIPERNISIGMTRETIRGIRKLEAESKHNYEVFEALYEMIYNHVMSEFENEGESYRHYRRYRFDRIKINKEDIFRKLKWDSNDYWNQRKLRHALYFLTGVRFVLFFLGEKTTAKKPLNLSPFILNYRELENGDIIFDANNLYFLDAERHIERALKEIEDRGQMSLFKKGELPKYLPELPRIHGESIESRGLKNYLKGKSVERGTKELEENVIDLMGKISDISDLDKISESGKKMRIIRGLDKLSKALDILKGEGFIKDYFPRIDKGYGRTGKKISITLS